MKSCSKERQHSSVEAPGFDHTGDILESFAGSYSLKCGINHIFFCCCFYSESLKVWIVCFKDIVRVSDTL